MKQIEVDVSELKPYPGNPRNNRDAVSACAASIRRFGYRNPILVDSDMVIVCGHTRFAALKRLGIHRITVNVADDMTPEQIKAYRLADNKVAEQSEWNPELLQIELMDLADMNADFDMGEFGFTPEELSFDTDSVTEKREKEKDDNSYYGDERERTLETYNLHAFSRENSDGYYNMPHLRKTLHVPTHLINFNEVLTSTDYGAGVHFFIDDYRFERIWNQPERYIEILKQFDCVFTPDFSLYMDMPTAMKIWNVYRSRLIGQMCQTAGIAVIPTMSWAEKQSFDYCFDGIEPGGVVAVSTVGVVKDAAAMKVFRAGMEAMIRECAPKKIILYGKEIAGVCGTVDYVCFSNENQTRLSNIGRS